MTLTCDTAFVTITFIAALVLVGFAAIRLRYWNKCKKRIQQIIDEIEVDA